MTDETLRNELKHLDHIMDRALAASNSGDLVQAERLMEELQRCNALMLRRLENVAGQDTYRRGRLSRKR